MKRLLTNGVIDRYPDTFSTLKFHMFEIFSKPRGTYILNWVLVFYSSYKDLVIKGKENGRTFKLLIVL